VSPDSYRKLVIRELTGSFRSSTAIAREAAREPGPGEVLIRNFWAGCNGVFDQNLCKNRIRYVEVRPPFDMGVEAVGEVIAVGEGVVEVAVGDPVATTRLGSGYREFQIAPVERVIRIREATPEILTLIPTGISAMVALERVADLRSGETIAVSAAAGGLGHIVVQLAKRAGNHVIGLTGSDAKMPLLAGLGVDRVVNYRRENLREVLEREYPQGLDIAYDTVGGQIFDAFLDNLARRGRLIVSGHTSDFEDPIERVLEPRVYHKLYRKSASIRGFQNPEYREFFDDAARRILDLYYAGGLKVLVDPTPFIGLESVPDAVEHLLSGANAGKVVIRLK
jgi:NADPH-dependent curcumin reductase CurA